MCVPSQALLRKVDPDNSWSIHELRAKVWDLAKQYLEGAADRFRKCVCINETLDYYEEFYVLEGLSKPWGPGAHFKCNCEDCFKDCTCHHSIMLSLLCEDEAEPGKPAIPLTMPAVYRTRGVPSRRRKRGRPSLSGAATLGDRKALDEASDEEEQAMDVKVYSPYIVLGRVG